MTHRRTMEPPRRQDRKGAAKRHILESKLRFGALDARVEFGWFQRRTMETQSRGDAEESQSIAIIDLNLVAGRLHNFVEAPLPARTFHEVGDRLRAEFPLFETRCSAWSQRLGVSATSLCLAALTAYPRSCGASTTRGPTLKCDVSRPLSALCDFAVPLCIDVPTTDARSQRSLR